MVEVSKASTICQPVHVRVTKPLSEQQVTAALQRDQPCRLGYDAGCVCTQALCRGSSVKKTFIQEKPEDHLLAAHTASFTHT